MLNGTAHTTETTFPSQNKVVLLFFKDYERDTFFPNDRYIKRLIKPIYQRFKKGPKVSGFLVWCHLLQRALEQEGYEVHLNNYQLAFQNPQYPVGLVGYPELLDGWTLPNPAILGPALFDHPKNNLTLMDDPRYQRYIVTCDWMYDQFAPVYGYEKVVKWFAGMDMEKWPDRIFHPKDNDVLIYDKIRWNYDHYKPNLLEPIKADLEKRGLSYEILRYQHYDHAMYQDALCRSRAMIFLCEHETQGMAYQEALTSNVPILAWDQGEWLDPIRPKFSDTPIPATSVPYFSDECGMKFKGIDEFASKFDQFWENLANYEPRQFIEREMSFKGSAEIFMKHYTELSVLA